MAKTTKKSKTTKTAKKHTSKKVRKTAELSFPEEIKEETFPVYDQSSVVKTSLPEQKKSFSWQYIVLIVIVLIIGFLALNRKMFLAAVVDGQPIFRWDLNNVLTSRYGQQTLDGMITEKLISTEAVKSGVTVTQSEIDARAKSILESFGSTLSVDEFLKLQGISRSEFDNQLRLQLTVQRLLSKDADITDAAIESYIASNSGSFIATEPAKLKEEARQAIIDTIVGEKFSEWIQGIREKAKIQVL